MFNKAAMLSRQTSKWLQAAKQPKIERTQSQVISMKTKTKKTEQFFDIFLLISIINVKRLQSIYN